ncbi:hypothetical protein RE6C_01563 [Rhodopirellula europaea 6C]|uniref:Uncharacterized protein n=1 Tax=Rhodopirellula europaea 6C TaxID=1263867 RepID=M2A7Z2_9BACT|nr:hypothetical protein RE6C_01563 [Rhodopirellula europaea 6C]
MALLWRQQQKAKAIWFSSWNTSSERGPSNAKNGINVNQTRYRKRTCNALIVVRMKVGVDQDAACCTRDLVEGMRQRKGCRFAG